MNTSTPQFTGCGLLIHAWVEVFYVDRRVLGFNMLMYFSPCNIYCVIESIYGFNIAGTNCVLLANDLTHWGRVTHICVMKLTIIGPDNGLSPGRRQAIIWTNAAILLIGPLGTNFNGILSEIHTFPFKKMQLKMSSGKWRLICLGLNVLRLCWCDV